MKQYLRNKRIAYGLAFLSLMPQLLVVGQPVKQAIEVIVSPDRPDWTYAVGEKVTFSVMVLQHQVPLASAAVNFEIAPDKMEPVHKGTVKLANGKGIVGSGVLDKPGFLRCTAVVEVDGVTYRGLATAAYSPQAIRPTVEMPADFKAFWDQAITEASRLPLDTRTTLMPDRCTESVNVYHVNVQSHQPGNRLYAIVCIPKKEGVYPALLHVPGSGILGFDGDIKNAEKGIITVRIGIHGIPLDMPSHVYTNLTRGALKGYPLFNLDHRDRYYYKRVYLGCIRAVDYIYSLPQFNKQKLAVEGGSQGGALAIVTAALDSRVHYVAALYPALCDLTGYLYGRAGGWPHMFNAANLPFNNTPEKRKTVPYFDVVNFARLVQIPGFYTWGYNDEVCPPTSYYAAFNELNAPKELLLVQETGHWLYPEQVEAIDNWLTRQLLDN